MPCVPVHGSCMQRDLTMTEKERREAFNDPNSWTPSVEFPSNGLIRVMVFDFYGLAIYDLQICRPIFDHTYHGTEPRFYPGFASRMYFVKRDGWLEEISKTGAYELMKKAERKENECMG